MKFCSLYSGSTGNSLFVQGEDTKILVDAGVSAKKIIEAFASKICTEKFIKEKKICEI